MIFTSHSLEIETLSQRRMCYKVGKTVAAFFIVNETRQKKCAAHRDRKIKFSINGMKERWEFDSIIFIVVGVNMELIKVIFRGF